MRYTSIEYVTANKAGIPEISFERRPGITDYIRRFVTTGRVTQIQQIIETFVHQPIGWVEKDTGLPVDLKRSIEIDTFIDYHCFKSEKGCRNDKVSWKNN